jgi:hypothetical protein
MCILNQAEGPTIPAVPQPAVYQMVIPLRTKDASHPNIKQAINPQIYILDIIWRNAHKTRDFTSTAVAFPVTAYPLHVVKLQYTALFISVFP